MKKVGYEKPILMKLGFDSEARGSSACTTGPSIGINNCKAGDSANSRCGAGNYYSVATVCISGSAAS
jgi:hypothetical protein